DLPRALFVGEEDDIVAALVDRAQEAEDDLERLTHLGWIAFGFRDAAIEQPVAFGDPSLRPLRLLHVVLRVDVEALVVVAAKAALLERLHDCEQASLRLWVGKELLQIEVATDELRK